VTSEVKQQNLQVIMDGKFLKVRWW